MLMRYTQAQASARAADEAKRLGPGEAAVFGVVRRTAARRDVSNPRSIHAMLDRWRAA
jgi:hypothetical protein